MPSFSAPFTLFFVYYFKLKILINALEFLQFQFELSSRKSVKKFIIRKIQFVINTFFLTIFLPSNDRKLQALIFGIVHLNFFSFCSVGNFDKITWKFLQFQFEFLKIGRKFHNLEDFSQLFNPNITGNRLIMTTGGAQSNVRVCSLTPFVNIIDQSFALF